MQLDYRSPIAVLFLIPIAGQATGSGPATTSPIVVPQQEPTAEEQQETCVDAARKKQPEDTTLKWPQYGQTGYKSPKKGEGKQYSQYTGYDKSTVVDSYGCPVRQNGSKAITPLRPQGSRK